MNITGSGYLIPVAIVAMAPVMQAHAAEKATPELQVQAAVEDVLGTIKSNPETRAGDLNKITAVVERQFLPYTDFQRSTRLAVGSAWRDATPDQRRQLFEQFQALLVRSYALSLSQLRDQNVKFRYKPAQAGSNASDSVVETRVLNNGEELQIDYRLQKTTAGWKIYDINMMGAWMIEVYRQQFADILAQGGIDGLLKYLVRHNSRQAAGG